MPKTTLLARASAIVALGALLAALAALFVILRAGHPVLAHLVHSDAMYLPVLFEDLLRRGGSLGDWFLTPAPYFFPDFPLYLLAWMGGGGVPGQITLFALLQTVLMAGALLLLARKALPEGRVAATAALAILFIWLALHADDPFMRLFSSAHHYGAFIVSLFLAALWLGLDSGEAGRRGRGMAAAIVVLVYLTTLSDALFLVQAVAPLLAVALLCRHEAAPATRPRRAALLLFVPAFAAMASYRFLVAHPTRYPARLGTSKLPANLDESGRIVVALFAQRPLLAAVLLLSLLAGLACVLAHLRGKSPAILPRRLQQLLMFSTLSCAAAVLVMLLSKTVQPAPRYLIAALCWPLVAGMFVLAHWLGAYFRYAALGLALMMSGLLAADAWRVRNDRAAHLVYYPEQIACIDRALAAAGAQHGIAQYWDAKRIQALSRRQLTVAQYTGELTPMEWITSQRFYSATYDFAIIAHQEVPEFRLPLEKLTSNGQPLQTVACGDRSVLLFGPGRLRVPRAVGAAP